jgi:hypothetical protein
MGLGDGKINTPDDSQDTDHTSAFSCTPETKDDYAFVTRFVRYLDISYKYDSAFVLTLHTLEECKSFPASKDAHVCMFLIESKASNFQFPDA